MPAVREADATQVSCLRSIHRTQADDGCASFLWESFLTHWHYRGIKDLVPANKGIFEGTPVCNHYYVIINGVALLVLRYVQVVNDEFLEHVRTGRCVYVRGDPVRCTKNAVVVNERKWGTKPGDHGREIVSLSSHRV